MAAHLSHHFQLFLCFNPFGNDLVIEDVRNLNNRLDVFYSHVPLSPLHPGHKGQYYRKNAYDADQADCVHQQH